MISSNSFSVTYKNNSLFYIVEVANFRNFSRKSQKKRVRRYIFIFLHVVKYSFIFAKIFVNSCVNKC